MQFKDLSNENLVGYLPEALFLEDLEGNILDVNRQACQLLGYEKEELLELTVDDLVPESVPTFLPDQIDEATRNGKPLETTNICKDGTEVPLELRGRIIEVEGDKEILVSVRDITGRLKVKQELEESKQRYQKYFEELGDAVFILAMGGEEHGKILEVNPTAVEQTGYSQEELIGMNMIEDLSLEPPPDFDLERVNKKLSRGETVSFPEKKRRKNGDEYWTEVVVTPIEYEGQKASLSINRDITDRKKVKRQLKENQERLEAAMEAGNLAWWRMELPSGELAFSDLKAEMLGYSPEKFEHYSDFTDLIHPEDYEKAMEAMRAHLDGKKERYETEYRIKKKNGDYRWIRDVGGLTETDGEHRIVNGVVIDINRRKEAELSLKAQRGKLEELHEAVDRFQQCEAENNLCSVAVQVTQRELNFDLCTFYFVEGDQLVPVADTENTELDELPTHNLDEGLAGESFQEKRSILGEDLRKEERAATDRSELRGYMSVPIGDVGVFQVASNEVGAFDKYDLKLAEILAGHLHEEVKRIRLEEELRQQAIRDPLTDLYNRRYFNETLQKEVKKADRYDKPLAFLMIDVNRFKEINDRYSHQTGDEVLREAANLLEKNVRDADTVVRYGGDEFLVMMPETNGGVSNTVNRLKKELDRWNEQSDLLDFPLTLAMGVSHWSPDQDRDVEEALNEADKKMYEDKRDNG